MTNLLEKAKKAQSAIDELNACIESEENESGAFAWHYYFTKKGIAMQMKSKKFVKSFGMQEVVKRDSSDIPYEMRTQVEGIEFFTIMSKEEYKELMDDKKEAL